MYQKICEFNNLLAAYQRARLGKRYQDNILYFSFFLENKLLGLQQELLTETYLPSPYLCFRVYEPKLRQVAAPAFRDRILQHSLVNQIEPLFERQFIFDSYACRKNKGTHFGLKRIKRFLESSRSCFGKRPIYCLRMDIQKYFASVSWDILLSIIKNTVKCEATNRLIEKIITTQRFLNVHRRLIQPPPDVIQPANRRGIPIGNLTSQLFANIYLNGLDHFAKERLKLRWYARYMDDFLVIHPDIGYLKQIKETLKEFLGDRLGLTAHPKKVLIQNTASGIPFVGYLIFYDHVLVRGKTLLRMRRKIKQRKKQDGLAGQNKLKATESSIRGHLKHANAFGLQKNLFDKPFRGNQNVPPRQLKLFS